MQEEVKRWINKYRLLSRNEAVLAACSGGPDSLALLHMLWTLQPEYGFYLAAAHVDHMFRGTESAEDAVFVEQFCRRLGVPFYGRAINVPRFIARSGRSEEDAARVLRYAFLRKIARQLGGAKIATGHHRDDQAETVLMHLLRGAGSGGLRGMLPADNGIIRPFLAVSRAEIDNYCRMHQLKPRLDSSNLNRDYLRNKIRLDLLPDLEAYNLEIRAVLCRTAGIIGDEHDYISVQAGKVWEQIVRCEGTRLLLDRKELAKQHIALQREIFRRAIEKKQGQLKGITFEHVEKLIKMALHGKVGGIFCLPGKLTAMNRYDVLELGWEKENGPELIEPPGIVLQVPGITSIPQMRLQVVAEISADRLSADGKMSALWDATELAFPIFVRSRQPGDRFQPLGMPGSKKLKDFFIDAKIPREKRDEIPIFYNRKGILWIGGFRQSEQAKVKSDTRHFCKLTINRGI
ncbi:phenylalanyl-trna synthetase b3/b4 [Lucifera butyrica]|uniref:tRNA(Ile)-lysidine synthase n=1 Tax=Lucifera butyrica TaxID=1351585 RepID=A0A498RBA1_9FIRM|nr:tRNA lysidine(34) synthetase TilS [Lucifera butyrica]VBB06408.1 phenylalanyl-trna synthetase b3/b4 [Lucifera butyrica]